MLTYMLDTNICIYTIKGLYPALQRRFKDAEKELCISSIVFAELRFGIEKSQRRDRSQQVLDAFLGKLTILPFDTDAGVHYGQMRAALERAGTPCSLHDTQIGAHARSQSLIVVTNNRREFDRMPGLRVESWV